MSGIGGRYLFVGDAALFVIAGQLGCDVQHARGAQALQTRQVGGVFAVAEVEERKQLRCRIGVHICQGRTRGRCGQTSRQSADQGVFAQFLVLSVELPVASWNKTTDTC